MAETARVVHILVCDDPAFEGPPVRVEPSATECRHTPCPKGYAHWHAWAERVSKTHAQVKCPRCGLWTIWLPKAEAKRINAARRKEVKAFLKAQGLPCDRETLENC